MSISSPFFGPFQVFFRSISGSFLVHFWSIFVYFRSIFVSFLFHFCFISFHFCFISGPFQVHFGPFLTNEKTHRHRFFFKSLQNKIGHNSPIVHMHPRSISVKNSGHSNLDFGLFSISIGQSFRHSFTLIITSSGSNWVHMTPISFTLGVNFGIAVNF